MSAGTTHTLSRRGFCICCAVAAGLGTKSSWLTPGEAFAKARGIVDTIRDAAATMPLQVHKLRGDVTVVGTPTKAHTRQPRSRVDQTRGTWAWLTHRLPRPVQTVLQSAQ